MSDDVSAWLQRIGLGQYKTVFADNDIDVEALHELSESDFKELGVSLGHRRKLQKALALFTDTGAQKSFHLPRELQVQAERRQLTVMFCDLVGSTKLATTLDPEDMREITRDYQDTCGTAILRFDGYVARYMGDGIMAYFGYPQAHEDDASRAIHAGLGILEGIVELNKNQDRKNIDLAVRVGIATGLVVVGDLIGEQSSLERAVVGETPNFAARLQAIAKPNTVVVSSDTCNLAKGKFTCESLGEHRVKGIERPIFPLRVIAPITVEKSFEATSQTQLTPLYGRDQELSQLLDQWKNAKAGNGQVSLLCGEPGIGKSRITQAMRDSTISGQHVCLRYQCSPYHMNSALHPVIEQLQWAANIEQQDSTLVKLDKLAALLGDSHDRSTESFHLFATLLTIPVKEHALLAALTAEQQKKRTLEVLLSQLRKLCERNTVLLIFEDVHWADPTSIALLHRIVELAKRLSILVIITYRSEFIPPWKSDSHISTCFLTRLDPTQIRAMVHKVSGGKHLPNAVLTDIVNKTDGIPLFVEELTKSVLESELLEQSNGNYVTSSKFSNITIPSSLQDSLMARLDRLAWVKGIAQTAAVIGRKFSFKLLKRVSHLDEKRLNEALNLLVDSELVFRRGQGLRVNYIFKHALVQDVAYTSLLKSKRKEIHRTIAAVIESDFQETVVAQPEVLAHHYALAQKPKSASEYFERAARRASEKSANLEAANYLNLALQQIACCPVSQRRWQWELELQVALRTALVLAKGYAAPEVEAACLRSRELCEKMGVTIALFPVLWNLTGYYLVRANLVAATQIDKQLIEIAEQSKDTELLIEAHDTVGQTCFYLGDLTRANQHFETVIQLYDPTLHRELANSYAEEDAGVAARAYSALALWLQGKIDDARALMGDAERLAETLSFPHSTVFVFNLSAWLAHLQNDVLSVKQFSEKSIAVCREQEYTFYLAGARILNGWSRVTLGESEEGLKQLNDGLRGSEDNGAKLEHPYFLALLSDALMKNDEIKSAQQNLDNALLLIDETNERWYEAELIRMQGNLLLKSNAVPEDNAEHCFQRAIAVAQKQGAHTLELRAKLDLARLLLDSDNRAKANDVLESIIRKFDHVEKCDDLNMANELLRQCGV